MKVYLNILSLTLICYLTQIIKSCTYLANANCDPRCNGQNCFVFLSQLDCCTGCAYYGQYFYRELNIDKTNPLAWTTTPSTRCVQVCPAQQYNINATLQCGLCNRNCTTCTGPTNIQCTSCAPQSYMLNSTSCFLMANHFYGYNPCPDPYYGIQISMKCQACPVGCSTCNIFLQNLMPGTYASNKLMGNVNCAKDVLCGYTLKCYTCYAAQGYFLQEGFCYKDQCRKYQNYNATAGSFDPARCYCMDGYYKAGLTCAICHYSCKTCTSNTASSCLSCPIGYSLSGTTCTALGTTTVKENWVSGGTLSGAAGTFTPIITPSVGSNTASCGSFTWLFGFSTYTVSTMTLNFPTVKLTYASSSFSNGGHYGVHFRGTFLFIDQWKSTASIIFREGSKDVYSYNYGMESVKGQYLCGQNYHDHITVIDFYFFHNTTTVSMEISASSNLYAWGVKDIMVQELGCHAACIKCDGPTQFNCTACDSALFQVLVDGDCVCDIANGYYLDGSTCTLTCTPGKFKDNTTRTCVNACVFPLMFHYNNTCFQKCPADAPYRRWNDSYCLAQCFDVTITTDSANLYKYDGTDKSCYNICPSGTYGDPQSKSCVPKCPSTSTQTDYLTYGAFADGNFCTQVCNINNPTKYAFPGTRMCVSSCPAGYYINQKNYGNGKGVQYLCESQCSVTLGGLYKYGNNLTKPYACVDLCTQNNTYADEASHMCLGVCNDTAYKQSVTIGGVVTRTCQFLCQSATYNVFGNNVTHFCVLAANCPNNTFGDYQSTFCQLKCTDPAYFGDNVTRKCQTTCTMGFKQNDTKTCIETCPAKNVAGNQQFGDPTTSFCQDHCTGSRYADNQTNRQCVLTCAATPMQSYGLNNKCVFNCSSSTWADPFHANRICTTSCTNDASKKSYGYNYTRKCVEVCPDTQYGQIISTIPLCVFICQNNQFGNPENNLCVDNCPAPYYGDPTGNRSCVKQCLQNGYYALNLSAQGVDTLANRTCVETCLYGWADNITRMCAMTPFDCSPGLYAHETNHKCVLPINCTGFADPITRKCVPNCFVNDTMRFFGDRDTHMCRLICPDSPDLFGDNSTGQCQPACTNTSQVKDPQNNRRCVTNNNCSRLPVALFGDTAAGTCVTARNCTASTYGDNNTKMCQSDCQGPNTLLYAEPVNKQCVDLCQLGYYAMNSSANVGICSRWCYVPLWADNKTVTCTPRCSPLTYGVNWTNVSSPGIDFGTCMSECPLNQFARDIDNLCVSNCGAHHWGQTVTRRCLTSPFQCPDGYYADNLTHMCVLSTGCSLAVNLTQYVADNLTKECLPGCPPHSTIINWADMTKKLCVAKCPYNKFGDNNTLRCVDQCKTAGVFNGEYADPQLRICVVVCSAGPVPTFGENTTFTCVQAKYCPAEQWAEDLYYKRVCVSFCPDPRVNATFDYMFADNVSKKCVLECPTNYFGNIVSQSNYGMCVSVCPSFANTTLKFADNSTKRCVKVCPQTQSTFGDPTTLSCVKVCPVDWYAQRIHTTLPPRYCVQTCDTHTWSQKIGRTCVEDPFDCPTIDGYHWYAHNGSTSCLKTCPIGQNLWGQNTTYTCELNCVGGSFKYDATRVCINLCPASLDDDGLFSDQGKCYVDCITPNYYRDPQNARSCQPICSFSPVKYYADDTTMKCVLTCPSYPKYYYAYDSDRTCRQDCPLNSMRDSSTRKCVTSCPNNTFFDQNSDSCLSKCPSDYSIGKIWYGDSTLAIPKCVQAASCPNTYFADDNVQLCVQVCTQKQWKHGKNCIQYCPDGYYGNKVTGFCVIPNNCPSNTYASNSTKTCVDICNGTFADLNNKICVPVCPVNYFADPAIRQCSLNCTNNATISLRKNVDNRTCISNCPVGLFLNPSNNNCQSSCNDPYYQDPTTQICVSICPSSPPLYGQNDTNKCLQACNNTNNQYKYEIMRVCVTSCPGGLKKDNFSRFCVVQCQNNTFADTQYCVFNCSPRYSLEDPNICTSGCPDPFYKDPTTFKCVLSCPTSPTQYYKVVTISQRKCDLSCPLNQFRDDFSYSCVTLCPPSPPTYADPLSGNCTTICSDGYYSYNQTRTCRTKCPDGWFADPYTKSCLKKCRNGTDLYGDDTLAIPKCVSLCSPGTFANPYTLECDSLCQQSPKTYGFDNTSHRICVQSCPYPYVADNNSHLCEIQCNSILYPYLDKASKLCVKQCKSPVYQFAYLATGQTIKGECVKFCPNGTFAYRGNNTCVARCPFGYYGDIQNNTCYQNCSLANQRFADPISNLCVDQCIKYNETYDSFADLYSRQCVPNCPSDKFTIKDNHTRTCEPRCTLLTQYADSVSGYCVTMCPDTWYADPVTLTCVKDCSLYSQRWMYDGNRSCVTNCKDLNLFANQFTRKCGTSFQCSAGFWGFITTGVCVDNCPTTPDMFGDLVTKTCVGTCPNQTTGSQNYYADYSTRQCVKLCPQTPALFALNDTRTCVSQCPNLTYADNYTRRCVRYCSIIPGQTFADNSTNRCVITCPTQPNYFASNQTYQCVFTCPSMPKMYADYSTRTCVKYCPGGDNQSYADQSSRFCVKICPGLTYMQNSTRTCQSICKTGFADPKSKYCIQVCPPYTYGHVGSGGNKTCKPACPLQTPALYAQDGNNLCMTECLAIYKTYRDPSTSRCVKICPINESMFADNVSRICRTQCPVNYYADYSTRFCVGLCPQVPALFAILDVRVCIGQCPNNSWADNKTRNCVIDICPATPDTYADNSTWKCVSICPSKPMTWSDNSTRQCVTQCPPNPDYYADNHTRRCVYNCSQQTFADSTTRKCVQTCPDGWFGQNQTRRCVRQCPTDSFADVLLHLCVQKCSTDPIYYGNPDNNICVPQCPSVNNSFGNPLTQQCVNYQLDGFSGCPDALFADNYSRLCVQVCPFEINATLNLTDTYGDNSTWKCVAVCPAGDQNTFADNSTMRCVKTCPQYPEYYAQNYSRRCVGICLQANSTYSGSFSDNSTRLCVQKCPSDPDYYSDNSTRRCVFYCPKNPLTFADNSTRRCVTTCPSVPDIYGDMSTGKCVQTCPQSQLTFADNSTRLCVKVCPKNPSLFGQSQKNRCVDECPNGTFADNSSRLCVEVCPQYPDTYGDPSTHRCVAKCPQIPDLYADPLTQQCVLRCPVGYYAQNGTRRCLPDCPSGVINYADNKTNRCVARCPQSPLQFETYGDNSTRDCVFQCPAQPFTYADNMTRICLRICNNVTLGGYADNSTRVCVQTCPNNTYGDITTRYCIRYCPNGWYAYDVQNLCVISCPQPYFSDPTTNKCVMRCPVTQLLFGQTFNRTCTPSCPQTTYADFDSQRCVARCPSKLQNFFAYDTFGYNDTNICVQQCPVPLYGYPVSYVCVDVCPDPYYQNITDHRCYKCPQQCDSCNYPQACLTCATDHYLYSGTCVQSCPTFPVITYANPNRQCGSSFQCTPGYFALNVTKSCVQTCPEGYFKNNLQQTCDSCQRGCSTCTNSSYCIVCNNATAIWFQFQCYTFCSPLRRFYTETGCVTQCPGGTYLKLTTCEACSSICKTCIVQPQNCITCADGFYLNNNLCVQKCPAGSKAVTLNNSLICQSCLQVDCTVQPLTYEVTQYVDNFQYKFQLKFSQPVNLIGQIQNIIAIKKKTARRLLQTTYEYLDYTIIDRGNGIYEFILNNYDPSLGTDQFQLQILDPSSIQSQSGQLPQTTRKIIGIDSTNSYSLKDFNANFKAYNQAIFYFSFILLIFSFWTHYHVWSPMFDFMQVLFAIFLINVVLPPTAMYSLGIFQLACFNFLPNFFTNIIPQAVYDPKIMNTSVYSIMKDFVFLRNMGQIYFIFIMISGVLLIIFGLSKKFFVKKVKSWCKKFIRETFWKKYLYGIVNILFLPVFLLGLINMRNYKTSTTIEGFSIFSSWLFMISFLTVAGYFAYKIKKLTSVSPVLYIMLQKAYNFIAYQKVVLLENQDNKFIYEKNQVDLSNARWPTINENKVLPFELQTKFGPMQLAAPLFNWLYKLMIAVFIIAGYQNSVVQILFILLMNIIYGLYLVIKKPYIKVGWKIFTSQITLHNLMVSSIILIVILAFKVQANTMSSNQKNLIATTISFIIVYGITINFIYFVYTAYNVFFQAVWKPFVASQIFKENYTIEHLELTKKYIEKQDSLKKLTRSRAQFLESIKVQKGQELAGMVLRDPNHSKHGQKFKDIKLRPNKTQLIRQDITDMFQTLHNEQQRSNKSVRSSQRLSKLERQRVRKNIFQNVKPVEQQKYESLKIFDKDQQQIGSSQNQNKRLNKLNQISQQSQIISQNNDQQLSFQYIQEQYPEGTPLEQIMKGCKKGNIVMP